MLLFVQSINGSINDNMHMDDRHRAAEIEKGEDGDFCPLKQETGQVSLHPSSSAKHSKKTDIVVVIYM